MADFQIINMKDDTQLVSIYDFVIPAGFIRVWFKAVRFKKFGEFKIAQFSTVKTPIEAFVTFTV